MKKTVIDMLKMATVTVLLLIPTIILLAANGILELSKIICNKFGWTEETEEEDIVIETRTVDIDELFANDPEFLAMLHERAGDQNEVA